LIGFWLLFTSGTVFFMVVLGGYTRLSGSGLSMTRWKPIDASMPSSEEKWEEEFSHYKKFPEYQLVNKEMSLEGFKKIFFVEWFHRAVGSSLGLIFGVPLSIFLYKGYLKTPMKIRLFLLLALGGSQGLIGWWMVRFRDG
jgi:heme a synthase